MSGRCPNCRMVSGLYAGGDDCPACRPMPVSAGGYEPCERWYCRYCGVVRDVPGDSPPTCHHNAAELPSRRMVPIGTAHPLATGPLPWGRTDPSTPTSHYA